MFYPVQVTLDVVDILSSEHLARINSISVLRQLLLGRLVLTYVFSAIDIMLFKSLLTTKLDKMSRLSEYSNHFDL